MQIHLPGNPEEKTPIENIRHRWKNKSVFSLIHRALGGTSDQIWSSRLIWTQTLLTLLSSTTWPSVLVYPSEARAMYLRSFEIGEKLRVLKPRAPIFRSHMISAYTQWRHHIVATDASGILLVSFMTSWFTVKSSKCISVWTHSTNLEWTDFHETWYGRYATENCS